MTKRIELSQMARKKVKAPDPQKTKVKPTVKTKTPVKSEIKTVALKSVKPKTSKVVAKSKDPKLVELQKIREDAVKEGNALLEKLENNVFEDNRRFVEQYEAMFNQLIVISGIAETKYLESKQGKDVYALMKVYDQMRECIADMKSLQSVGHYIDALVQEVLNPLTTTIAQTMLDFVNHVNSHTKNHRAIDPDVQAELVAYVGSQAKTVSVNINEAYHASMENTRRILSG